MSLYEILFHFKAPGLTLTPSRTVGASSSGISAGGGTPSPCAAARSATWGVGWRKR